MLSEKEIVDCFCDLTSLDAPSRAERPVADAVIARLSDLGVVVDEDDAGAKINGNCGNLYARFPGTLQGPPILFCAHMDTVEPCIGKKIIVTEDRVIRSDGTTVLGADNVAALTAILTTIRSLHLSGQPHRDIELLFTVGEEIHLQGSRHADLTRFKAGAAYVLDANRAPGIGVIAAPGHVNLVFEIEGQAAHAGISPEEGVSAIAVAAQAIAKMRLGRVDPGTTANIGRIEGGTVTNIVAERCKITAECRSLDQTMLLEQSEHMKSCVRTAAESAGARVSIQESMEYHAYQVPMNGLAMRQFQAACKELGITPQLITLGGGSDMNVLARGGLAGMVLSCGMQQMHSCQEFITIDDLVMTTALVEKLMTLPVPA